VGKNVSGENGKDKKRSRPCKPDGNEAHLSVGRTGRGAKAYGWWGGVGRVRAGRNVKPREMGGRGNDMQGHNRLRVGGGRGTALGSGKGAP